MVDFFLLVPETKIFRKWLVELGWLDIIFFNLWIIQIKCFFGKKYFLNFELHVLSLPIEVLPDTSSLRMFIQVKRYVNFVHVKFQ